MGKYAISSEFARYSWFKPPISKAMLPVIHAVTEMAPEPNFDKQGADLRKLYIYASDAAVPAYLYDYAGSSNKSPCLVYFHGGGFAMGPANYQYRMALEYAVRTPCKLLFVNYRLAPEYKYPIPLFDCFGAYSWVRENAGWLGIDADRIAVGGDSAGGNLAAGVCLCALERGIQPPCFQMLVYPVIDRRMRTRSMLLYDDTPMWNAKLSKRMWSWYLDGGEPDARFASPLEAESLAGMPDAYIETAEFDCLRDEGRDYAAALMAAGCVVELNETKGTMHGYDISLNSKTVRTNVFRRVESLRRGFNAPRDAVI